MAAALALLTAGAPALAQMGASDHYLAQPEDAAPGVTLPQRDSEFLWLNRFTSSVTTGGQAMRTDGLDLIGVDPVQSGTTYSGPSESLGVSSERVFFGTVGVSESMAFTGRIGSAGGEQFEAAEANLGVRFSTRAGEQLVLSVEPSITWTPSVSDQRLNLSLREESSVNVGAAATLALSDRWYLSGMAQIEQGMSARLDGTVTLRDTAIIGGLLTGIRF